MYITAVIDHRREFAHRITDELTVPTGIGVHSLVFRASRSADSRSEGAARALASPTSPIERASSPVDHLDAVPRAIDT